MWGKRLSQNRSSCCGRSSSSATSLMVRNASGALFKAASFFRVLWAERLIAGAAVRTRVDALLENRRRLEHHNPSRRDWHFRSGLRIAPDALALLAHHERAERGKLHALPALEAIGDLPEHQLDERSRFGSRQTDLLINGLAQISARNGLLGHRRLGTPNRYLTWNLCSSVGLTT